MDIDDPALPSAAELAGPAARDVVDPVVTAAGGLLHQLRCVGIHYVPGRELVARYDCDITWPTGRTRDTLLASTTVRGRLPGTVAVTANSSSVTLEADVWRWPFDPLLVGLSTATTPAVLAGHVRHVTGGGEVGVEVVAYRPTERAVVRVTDDNGQTYYLKVLPPARVAPIAARHEALHQAGVCVPRVLHADEDHGLLLLEAMPGATLRDRIKSSHDAWPSPESISARLGAIDAPIVLDTSRASRTRDAVAHMQLLATIVPEAVESLDALRTGIQATVAAVEQRTGPIIHGDLHESQLFVDDTGTITGIIDLDDLGPGDPLDDPAALIGHLEYRAITGDTATQSMVRPRITELRDRFAAIHGAPALDLTIAAVLVGLATGPFRAQAPTWRELTHTVLDAANRYAATTHAAAVCTTPTSFGS